MDILVVSIRKEESKFSPHLETGKEGDVTHSGFWMQPDSSPLLLMLSVFPASSLILNSPLDQRKAVGLTGKERGWFSREMRSGRQCS